MSESVPILPIVQITLSGMKQTILHAMSDHLLSIDADIRKAVDEAVANFDLRAAISNEVEHHLTKAISDATSEAMYSIRTNLCEMVSKSVSEKLKAHWATK